MLVRTMLKIGLLGGTFDPIHLGHLRAAEEVYEKLTLDEILFIPSGNPPHKHRPDLTPFPKRLEMVRLAIEGISHFRVTDLEGREEGPSYSVRTLEALRFQRPNVEFFFILGLDAFCELETWYAYQRLPLLAHLVVINRGEKKKEDFIRKVKELFPQALAKAEGFDVPGGYSLIYLEVTRLDISSTIIRQIRKQGRSIRFLVPEKVRRFILQHRLYSGQA